MRAAPAFENSAAAIQLHPAVWCSQPAVVARLRDIWSVCVRAHVAAHHYEAHKFLSEQELTTRGLTRSDLPRAAFRKLTGTR